MGISSALYSGVSGLNTNSQAMSVIGNNLANTNTFGFKGSRTVFSDLLSSNINGSGGVSQVGRGVGMSRVDSIFSQGTFESTESSLDVAIEGEGFFMLRDPGETDLYYSRAGSFRFSSDGYLVSPEGFRVQGQPYTAAGVLAPGNETDIQITNRGLSGARATTGVTLSANLDSSEPIIPLVDNSDPLNPITLFDITDPETYNYANSTQIYDSLGNPHLITTYFNKTSVNSWEWNWSATRDDGTVVQGAGTAPLTFTDKGFLEDPANPGVAADFDITDTIPAAALNWNNGTNPTDITLTFDITQFNSISNTISKSQNGFGPGEMTGVSIDEAGAVVASYANGEQVKIAHLVLGKFTNPGGLELAGRNVYRESAESGVPRTGLPGSELGKIFTNSLEQSNVDMGAEFVRMITVQRGFQANSKIITTVDELLNELINLKR